jgi:putative PIN family toxin of toxin-antitoxin system
VRVVIDTNVLISAIFWTGKPKQLLNHVRRQKITFVTSNQLLDELRQILRNWHSWSNLIRLQLICSDLPSQSAPSLDLKLSEIFHKQPDPRNAFFSEVPWRKTMKSSGTNDVLNP